MRGGGVGGRRQREGRRYTAERLKIERDSNIMEECGRERSWGDGIKAACSVRMPCCWFHEGLGFIFMDC